MRRPLLLCAPRIGQVAGRGGQVQSAPGNDDGAVLGKTAPCSPARSPGEKGPEGRTGYDHETRGRNCCEPASAKGRRPARRGPAFRSVNALPDTTPAYRRVGNPLPSTQGRRSSGQPSARPGTVRARAGKSCSEARPWPPPARLSRPPAPRGQGADVSPPSPG